MTTPAEFVAHLLRLLDTAGPAPVRDGQAPPGSGPVLPAVTPPKDVGALLLPRAYSLHNRHRGRAQRYLAVHSILSRGR
jgi:hypothetical protein